MSRTQHEPRVINGLQSELAGFNPALMPDGTYFFARDQGSNGTLYLLSIDGAGVRTWKQIGGIGTGINIVTATGAGVTNVPQNTDILISNPGGGAQTLQLPQSALNDQGRAMRLILVSGGEVTIQAVGPDVLWTGIDSMTLTLAGETATFVPTNRWMLTDIYGAPQDFTVYVDPAGNDDNAGTMAEPILTVTEALGRAARLGWKRYALVYMSAGTYNQPPGTSWVIPEGDGAEAWPLQIIGTEQDSGLGTLTVGGYNPGPANEAAGPEFTGLALGIGDYRGYRVRMTGGTSAPATSRQSFMVGKNDATTLTLSAASGYFTMNAGDTFVLEEPATFITWATLPQRSPTITGGQLVLRGIRFDLSGPLFAQETFLLLQHVWFIGTGSPASRGLWLWGGAEAYSGWTTIGRFGIKNSPTFNPSELDRCGIYVRMDAGGISQYQEGVFVDNNATAFLHENTLVNATADASGTCVLGLFASFVHGDARVSGDGGAGCYAYASTWFNVTPRPIQYPVLLPTGAISVESSVIDCANCRFDGTNGISVLSRNGSGYVYGNEFIAGVGNDIEVSRAGSLRLATNTVSPGSGAVGLGGLGAPITLAAAEAGANDIAAGPLSQLCYVGP